MLAKMMSDVKYSLLSFFRNRGGVFWTFGFPIVLMVILGFLWGSQTGAHELYYLDSDNTQASVGFPGRRQCDRSDHT